LSSDEIAFVELAEEVGSHWVVPVPRSEFSQALSNMLVAPDPTCGDLGRLADFKSKRTWTALAAQYGHFYRQLAAQ
jgi:hypothetical protein